MPKHRRIAPFAVLLFTGLVLGWLIDPAPADAAPKRTARTGETGKTAPAVAPAVAPAWLEALEWREVGPYRGGRSAAVTGVPGERQVYYFGATGGGVWKTTDSGASWKPVSDGFFGGSIGAVAVSEKDPNVVYAGGGEVTVRGNVSHGDGVWKSVDAGKTWVHMGLPESRHIPRLRIDPRDPNRVYAAVLGHLSGPNEERGVYRSKDGGETWERVLHAGPDAGAVDLILDPTNPRILYASLWRVRRTPWSLESGGEGSGLWKSTDGGDTWQELSRKPGLPQGTLGIIGITVSPSNPDNLYAIVEAEDGGVFRSKDGGETWERTNEQRDLRQRAWYYTRIYADPADEEVVYVVNVRFHKSKDGGRTFAMIPTPHGDNHDLWIDPADPQRMIEANDGGVNVTEDGGLHWSTQANQPTAQIYRVSVDDAFPYRLLGGQQDNSTLRIRSRSVDDGAIGPRDWDPSAGGESGFVVAQPGDPDVVYGGSYGGLLIRLDHRTGEGRAVNVWPDDPMGWGAAELRYRFQWNYPIFFSPHDPHSLYAAGNVLFRTRDDGQSWQALSPDLTRDDKSKQGPSGGPITKDNTSVEYYATIFAALESPHEQGVLWTGSDDGLVHVSRDDGATWTDVTPPGLPEWTQINSLEAHPFEPGGLYLAGTRYKLDDFEPYLFRTLDYGATWQRIDAGIPRDHFTRVVRADPKRRGLLYAGTENGVYASFDDGGHWQSLQRNLPLVPITDLLVHQQDLIAATQGRGFWILDDLSSLHQLAEAQEAIATGAPAYLFVPRGTQLPAGARAKEPGNRGQNPPPGALITFYLAQVPESDTAAADTERGTADATTAANSGGKDEKTPIRLEILGEGGHVIRSYTPKPSAAEEASEKAAEKETEKKPEEEDLRQLELKAGTNRFAWDLAYPAAERFPGLVLWNDDLSGPTALPGTYRARLVVGGWSSEVPFEVLPDPRSSATAEDLKAQFDFAIETRDGLTRTHKAIRQLRQARKELETLRERLTGTAATPDAPAAGLPATDAPATDLPAADTPTPAAHPELEKAIDDLLAELKGIEEALYQTKNQSPQDPLNYPVRLNDKLAALLRLASLGENRPTDSMVQVREQLQAAIDAQLTRLDELWRTRLPEINRLAREAEIPAVQAPRE